jgi:hypothetical protein
MGRESSVENAEIMMMGKPTNVVHVVLRLAEMHQQRQLSSEVGCCSAMKKDNVLNSRGVVSLSLSLSTDGVLIRRCHVIMAVSAYNKDTGDDTPTGRRYHFPLTYY